MTTRDEMRDDTRGRVAWLGIVAVGVEAVILTGYAGYLGVEAMVGTATERTGAVVMAVLYLALGGALALLARALKRRSHAALVPTLLWQVLQATVAVPALSTAPLAGIGLLLLCVTAAVGAVSATRA